MLLFTIPVADVLSWFGKRVDHRGYMYYSPFRDEAQPSMRVTVNPSDGTWMWADYGGSPELGKKADGGGCLDMVRRLGNFANDEAAVAELKRIAASRGVSVIEEESRSARKAADKPAGIVVDDVSLRFTRRNLVRYADSERGIPEDVLSRYCRQVTYHARSNASRRFTVIGFPNNAGGYALRGTGAPQRSKRNSVSGISTFSPDGTFRPEGDVSSEKCVLFEGFFDFLSYMVWKGVKEPGMDACVLNSTSNLLQAKSWIVSHGSVRCFFDNDEAGEQATRKVESWCRKAGLDFKDGRTAYKGYDDVNEAWTAELSRRRERLKPPQEAQGASVRPR